MNYVGNLTFQILTYNDTNFVKSNSVSLPNIPTNSATDLILDIPTNQKGLKSKIYTLISHFRETSIDKISKDWEVEFSRVLDDNDWDSALT